MNSPQDIAIQTRANRYTIPHGTEEYEHLLEIKRSEFIGHIKRVSSQDEARDYIESLRKTYHDARHVCSAFVMCSVILMMVNQLVRRVFQCFRLF